MLVSVITKLINYSSALMGALGQSAARDFVLPFSAPFKKTTPFCCFSEEKGRIANMTGPRWSVEEEGKRMRSSAPLQHKDVPRAVAGEKFPRGSLFWDGRLLRVLLLGLPLPFLGG